jgi:hypothetical protein
MSTTTNQAILLDCLARFERQVKEDHRDDVVRLFCTQVIPLLAEHEQLAAVRDSWKAQWQCLYQQLQDLEKKAIEKVDAAVVDIKKFIGDGCSSSISNKIALIERYLSNKEGYYGETLSKILYWELKELLQSLLEAGFTDVCAKYAKLGTRKTYIQRPQPVPRTALIKSTVITADHKSENQTVEMSVGVADSQKTIWVPLTKDEVEVARQNQQNDLVTFTSDMEYVNEAYIATYTFASSAIEAIKAGEALWKKPMHDPAVVWYYFELAMRFWNTSEFYWDEIIRPRCGDDYGKHFEVSWSKSVWREIASIKDQTVISTRENPIIFTKDFFESGLRILNGIANQALNSKKSSLRLRPWGYLF